MYQDDSWGIWAFCLLCVLQAAQGFPLPRAISSTHTDSIIPRDGTQCGFAGNSDIYGLGIRLGVYLQWITSLLANNFYSEAIAEFLDTCTIFMVSLFLALAISTFQTVLRAPEIIILLHFCFGFMFSVLSIWGQRTKSTSGPLKFPLLGSCLRLSLSTLVCVYSVWFWFLGTERLDNMNCPTFSFFFAKLDIYTEARIWFQFKAIVYLVIYGLLFIRELLFVMSLFGVTALGATTVFYCYAKIRKRMDGWSFGKAIIWTFEHSFIASNVFFWMNGNGEESAKHRPEFADDLIKGVFKVLGYSMLGFLTGLWRLTQFLFFFIFKASPLPSRRIKFRKNLAALNKWSHVVVHAIR
jgi:hypothetical protein